MTSPSPPTPGSSSGSSSSDPRRSSTLHSHGNYQGYYASRSQAHPSAQAANGLDPRVEALIRWLRGQQGGTAPSRSILDVGCNAGKIGIQLASQLPGSALVGVDIDSKLVGQAKQSARKAGLILDGESNRSSEFDDHEPTANQDRKRVKSRPKQDVSQAKASASASRASFNCQDWVFADDIPATSSQFDLVLALSVSKWIHIHHSDIGLLRFSHRLVAAMQAPATVEGLQNEQQHKSLLLFEPQPYSSYNNAKRELPSGVQGLRYRFRKLRLRTEDFVWLLEGMGLQLVGTAAGGEQDWEQIKQEYGFTRPLFLFQRPAVFSAAALSFQAVIQRAIDVTTWPIETPEGQGHLPLPFPWVSRNPMEKGQFLPAPLSVSPSQQDGAASALQLKPRSLGSRRRTKTRV